MEESLNLGVERWKWMDSTELILFDAMSRDHPSTRGLGGKTLSRDVLVAG